MILIDENAEQKLVARLEAFKQSPEHATRCIHFRHTDSTAPAGIKEVVIASVQRHLSASDPQIYFCDTGDIVVLAKPMTSKEANPIILDMVDHVHKAADGSWVMFDELHRQVHALLARIAPALEAQRNAEETMRKLHEQQLQARKREAILSHGMQAKAQDIQQRRSNRPAAELMMIEDDGFSRRLVENVLQKQYALTSLSDASDAIDRYARIAPDLLFLDINLPDVTGHELLERLLTIDPQAHVVMLSGNADQANIVTAMRKGAKGFIAKPFTKEKLFQYIERCDSIVQKQHRPHTV